MGRVRGLGAILVVALVVTLGLASTASARDPGRWLLTGATSVPNDYWQGLTPDPARANLFFIGPFQGLWRTTPQLHQTAGVAREIPQGVTRQAGYNHIGDPTWLRGEGGRVLLPMECYKPNIGNTCGTGAFGLADPDTLRFRYYVQLDPAEIQKAMWAETSPDGSLIWTSSGDDLLAYRASAVSKAHRAPTGPLLNPVRRLKNAVPPTGVTGAMFRNGRLLLAGAENHVYQVWSVDTRTGARRLKLQMHLCGESEGLGGINALGGRLHWLISPSDPDCHLTFGPTSALLHFRPAPANRAFKVRIKRTEVDLLPGKVSANVRVSRKGRPVPAAVVKFAGGTAHTNRHGIANVSTYLQLPGRFKALARTGHRYGISKLAPIEETISASSTRAQRPDAG